MSRINGKINRKKLVAIFIIIILVIGVVYILSMQNPVINAFLINAKYYKRDSYKEQIIIDGIVFCDTDENVITVSELKEQGADITGYVEGEFSDGVKINDDIEAMIFDDGVVYIKKITNVQNHDVYVYGITNDTNFYTLVQMYGFSLYNNRKGDIVRYGIEGTVLYPDDVKSILKIEDFPEDYTVEMWNYYEVFGDCDVDVVFRDNAVSEIYIEQIFDN